MDRGELYDAAWDEAAYRSFPATIATLLGGRSCTLYQYGGAYGMENLHSSYFPADLQERFATEDCDTADFWGTAGVASGIVGKAVVMDDLVPERAFRNSYTWNEIFQPLGDDTGHCLGIMHRLDGAILCTAVQRSFSSGRFSGEEAAALDAVATDLHRIYLTRNLLSQRGSSPQPQSELLQAGHDGLILVDKSLRVIEATHEAERLLSGSGVAAIRQRFLQLSDRAVQAQLRAAVVNTIDRRAVARASFLCATPASHSLLRFLVLPWQQNGGSGCIIHVSGPGRPETRVAVWLAEHYALTKAEIQVAQAIGAGRSPDEISTARQVSLHTVRAQIRQILEKTGSSSTTKLMALLHNLA